MMAGHGQEIAGQGEGDLRRDVIALRVVTALIGLALVGIPGFAEPAWAVHSVDVGLIAVLAAAISQRAWPGTLAAMTAIAECATSRLGMVALAAEGLLLLAYLLLLNAPAGLPDPAATRRWLRLQLPAVLTGLAAACVVLAVLSLAPGASPWMVLAGLAAAVVAYLAVLPLQAGGGSRSAGR